MGEAALLSGARTEGLPERGRVVVGFSGGADSTALAHWLAGQVARERILLVHVNHLLRGEEARRDEDHARAFARQQGLALRVERVDVAKLAAARGQGLEECGRGERYRVLLGLAPGEEDRVLTAHNADDNGETILLNLCRGAGTDGLRGIPRQRGKILRPLLDVSREEIEAYCRAAGLSFVTDSTNLSDAYTRNRVRHRLLPVLKELNPRFLQAAGRAAELLERDREFLRQQAEGLLTEARPAWGQALPGLEAAPLRAAHESVRSRAMKLFLERAGCGPLEKKHLDLARRVLLEGGRAQLPGGRTLGCAQGLLWVGEDRVQEDYELPLGLGETRLPGGLRLVLTEKKRPETENREKIQNLLFKNAVDCAILSGEEVYGAAPPPEKIRDRGLTVRNRRPGDRFTPAGRGLSKPLKQIFQELRVPAALRASVPLLVWGGRVIWCPGAGPAEGFQVREETKVLWTVELRVPGTQEKEE